MKFPSRSLLPTPSPALFRPVVFAIAVITVASSSLMPPALAQPLSMDPVIVTATRLAQPASTLLSDVRVIDAADIANAGNQTLVELLQAQGGVEIASNGGPGQPSAVFLRRNLWGG